MRRRREKSMRAGEQEASGRRNSAQ